MTQEIKTDATQALNDIKAETAKLEADEKSAVGYVKAHVVYAVGLVCLIVGAAAGYFLAHH